MEKFDENPFPNLTEAPFFNDEITRICRLTPADFFGGSSKFGKPKRKVAASRVRYVYRRSPLSIYMDILKVLASNPSLKITRIMHKANVNYNKSIETLQFLSAHDLVEKRTNRTGKAAYNITQKGITAIKYFKDANIIFLQDNPQRGGP